MNWLVIVFRSNILAGYVQVKHYLIVCLSVKQLSLTFYSELKEN